MNNLCSTQPWIVGSTELLGWCPKALEKLSIMPQRIRTLYLITKTCMCDESPVVVELPTTTTGRAPGCKHSKECQAVYSSLRHQPGGELLTGAINTTYKPFIRTPSCFCNTGMRSRQAISFGPEPELWPSETDVLNDILSIKLTLAFDKLYTFKLINMIWYT